MKKAISICLVFVISFSTIFFSNFNTNLYADEIIRVDPTSSGQMQPGIYGTKIVWEDIRDGISQIYVHDLVAGNSLNIFKY